MSTQGRRSIEIAFFAVRPTADQQGYIGAVLVADERGIPREFRCTHPVRPTPAQRALYGKNLDQYITLELCGKPLIDAITTHPVACLVETRRNVALRELVSLPVLFVQKLGEILTPESSQSGGTPGTASGQSRSERLDSHESGFAPLSVLCQAGYDEDLEEAKAALEQVFQHVDLVEPFERITTALQVVSERDERFR